jgi:hypothetical protein
MRRRAVAEAAEVEVVEAEAEVGADREAAAVEAAEPAP